MNREFSDYYITPTHDFTRYTRDYEQKYWSKDTSFDWQQDVTENLRVRLETLPREELSRVAFLALPQALKSLEGKISQIRNRGLPLDEDALKAIGECVPFDRPNVGRAMLHLEPLKRLARPVALLKDQLEIAERELSALREQQRLALFRTGNMMKRLESDGERREQSLQLSQLVSQVDQLQRRSLELTARSGSESAAIKAQLRREARAFEPGVSIDLEETRQSICTTLATGRLPEDQVGLARIRDLILKRQIRGLKDIANHALVVEQSAIAPLTMGIIHYRRHREIQEAMTTFVNDEAKHSAVFRRFLAEKLEAKEHISVPLVRGSNRYLWLARFMPGVGMFLAVIIEAVGGAYIEFFGDEQHMPDPLFGSICKTIAERDERRHMDLCAEIYTELYRKDSGWERLQNGVALRVMMKTAYGDKTEDHPLIQAFLAFGVESEKLYQHTSTRLSDQLAKVGVFVHPERLLGFIGRHK